MIPLNEWLIVLKIFLERRFTWSAGICWGSYEWIIRLRADALECWYLNPTYSKRNDLRSINLSLEIWNILWCYKKCSCEKWNMRSKQKITRINKRSSLNIDLDNIHDSSQLWLTLKLLILYWLICVYLEPILNDQIKHRNDH